MAWLWDDRLVEVWGWPGKAGTGVAVGARGVLTARHVIEDAGENYEPGRIMARVVRRGEAASQWVAMKLTQDGDDPDWDLAVLEVDTTGPRADAWASPSSPSPVFAALGTAIEPGCEVVGFPDAEVQRARSLRPAAAVRQSEQLRADVAPMGQAKPPVAADRQLPRRWIPVDASTSTPDEQAGWGGMSGGGVLLPDGRLIGVVVAAETGHQHRRLYMVSLADALTASPRLAQALAAVVGAPVVIQPRYKPVVPSGYLELVRAFAPPELKDRERELAELAAFCTQPRQDRYAWWRAGAWAGKSALMSWFVLHPPPGVRVVSFFVTARFAGQDDHRAFTDVLLAQLTDVLLNQGAAPASLPKQADLTEATREPRMLAMLTEAATACQQQGERLVLVVDGLDEDQGVSSGLESHSIAALLPATPPAGMRIIVVGRPNPPIPSDVPDDHPLRDPAIVRTLGQSPHAEVIKADAQRELKRLLRGTLVEQDLLGLLTASGGGLSGADLAELTGCMVWEVEEILDMVPGRTFNYLPDRWRPDTKVYVLGHEELQKMAGEYLGRGRLDAGRQRLHTWADSYRERHWPPETPEYLLLGYYRMLKSTGDLRRMITLATDIHRHDRVLKVTGSDTASLTEIFTAQGVTLGRAEPDLSAIGRLAVHRYALATRNASVPTELPAVWARLGQPERAEALADVITDPFRQVEALAAVVKGATAAGDHDRAARVANLAEAAARAINWPAGPSATLVGALVTTGNYDRAETVALNINDPYQRGLALAAVLRAVAKAGDYYDYDYGRARRLAGEADTAYRDIITPEGKEIVLTKLRRAIAPIWKFEDASKLADIPDSELTWSKMAEFGIRHATKSEVQTNVVEAMTAARDYDRAETVALVITDPFLRVEALTAVVKGVAAAGDHDRAARLADQAEITARAITDPDQQARALTALVKTVAVASDGELAARLADQAEAAARAEITRSATDPYWSPADLAALVGVVAAAGSHELAARVADQAEAAARAITRLDDQAKTLAALAKAAAAAGDNERAARVADQAEAAARAITAPCITARASTALTAAAAAAGDYERAARLADQAEAAAEATIAREITDPYRRVEAFTALAEVGAAAGDNERAARLAARAEALARAITEPYWQERALTALAETVAALVKAAATAGDYNWAETIAHTIADPRRQAEALTALVKAVAESGDYERAARLADQAETTARTISYPDYQAEALTALVSAVATARDYERAAGLADQAETAVSAMTNFIYRAEALAALMSAVAEAGDHERAARLADQAQTAAETAIVRISDPYWYVRAMTALVEVRATVGDLWGMVLERAEKAAHAMKAEQEPDEQLSGYEEALIALIKALATAGDYNWAETYTKAIAHPYRKVQALIALAKAAAVVGDHGRTARLAHRAERFADTIREPDKQAEVLTELAGLAAAENESGWARSLVAKAFDIGDWTKPVKVLDRIQPTALIAITDEWLSISNWVGVP